MHKSLTIAAVLSLAAAVPVAAQTGFGAHAGVSIPTGDYGDVAETGFSGGLDLTVPLAMVAPGLSWYTSADAIAHSVEDLDDGFLFFPLLTGLRFTVPVGPVAIFGTGQAGAVFARGASPSNTDAEFTTSFGYAVGAGAHITDNFYAGVKYYPLGDVDFEYDPPTVPDMPHLTDGWDVSFFDIYVGFGVF